jgi:hypothetical protein
MNATHAIVVPFEELAPVVDGLRERTCISKPSHGMPPHVTLLYPAPGDVDAIAGVLVAFVAFDVVFARLDRFPGTLWLAPEPAESGFDEVVSSVELSLPLRSRAKRAVLLEQAQPDQWHEVATFALEDA